MGRAKRPDSDIVYIVDLEKRSCTCLRFQDTDIPCGHAVAFIRRLNQAPSAYMPDYVKNQTLINSYSQNFPPINTADIRSIKQGILVDSDDSDTDSDASSGLSEPPLENCEPPVTRAPRGRPPKKRKRNGDNDKRRKKGKEQALQRAPFRYNARSCTRPHT
jgi:hypothetical protein